MSRREPSGAAVGWIAFAGFIMILGGSFAILAGLAALINPESFPASDALFQTSGESWGWWHLIMGTIVLLAGFGVFTGNVLARTVGVIAATVSAISAFVWLPVYPVWGIILISIDFAIIWALTVHGRDVEKSEQM
ncbi:MAG: hypothetical protein WB297_12660 [Actinomycetota bacterium]